MTTEIESRGGSLDGSIINSLPDDTIGIITVRKINDGYFTEIGVKEGVDRDAVEIAVWALLMKTPAKEDQ